MSTNKTPNYNLHSWLPQDEFHVTEINENFTKLDQAVKTEITALDSLLKGEINARIAGELQLVSGTYTGAEDSYSKTRRNIVLGAKPKAVIVTTEKGYKENYGGIATQTHPFKANSICMEEDGFSVSNDISYAVYLNYSDTAYFYFAIL